MWLHGRMVLACCASFTTFLGTLHWPAGADDMEHSGVSYLEIVILFEQWAVT